MNTEFNTIFDEYKNNSGDIFTSHLFDNSNNNKEILETYRKKYETNFKKEKKDVSTNQNYQNTHIN